MAESDRIITYTNTPIFDQLARERGYESLIGQDRYTSAFQFRKAVTEPYRPLQGASVLHLSKRSELISENQISGDAIMTIEEDSDE